MTPERVERQLKMARQSLSSKDGDLDCCGWMLTTIHEEAPENTEVAEVLALIIQRIDRECDANRKEGLPCHLALGTSSPSPYVRAMEAKGICQW
jgi:hypothetical protein